MDKLYTDSSHRFHRDMSLKGYLDGLQAEGINVNWATILTGWEGIGYIGKLLATEEVIAYALYKLESNLRQSSEPLIRLAGANEDDVDLVRQCLTELSDAEVS